MSSERYPKNIRVVAHENVMIGSCVLIGSHGELVYAGMIGRIGKLVFPDNSTWYLNDHDYDDYKAYYEKHTGSPLYAQVHTLQ